MIWLPQAQSWALSVLYQAVKPLSTIKWGVDYSCAQVLLERCGIQTLVDYQETTKDADLLLRRHAPRGLNGTANLEPILK